MSNDAINNWVDKAKTSNIPPSVGAAAIQVVRRSQSETRGNMILAIAEKIRPYLLKMFEGVHDGNGMLMQQAHVRGMALNMAQNIVKEQEAK